MFLPVDPASGLPVYRQIMDQVRRTIVAGHLAVGEKLPSIRDLAAVLRINPLTVGKAYTELERSGLIEMRRGLGMYVRPQPGTGHPSGHFPPAGVTQAASRLALESAQAGLTRAQTIRLLESCWRTLNAPDDESAEGGSKTSVRQERKAR